MTNSLRATVLLALAGVMVAGCSAPDRGTAARSEPQSQAVAPRPTRLTVIAANEPPFLYYPLAPPAIRGSAGIIYDFVGPGVSLTDNEGAQRPILVEQPPSVENGLWKVLPDGRRLASQLVQGIGYAPSADGVLRDPGGGPLSVEIRGYASRDIQVKSTFPVADYWQRIGVAAEPAVPSAQQAADLQDQATFRSFLLVRQNYHLSRLIAYHSSEARLPERNYRGSNNGRYINPEMDALIERYQATVPWAERMEAAGRILHHMTDHLAVMPLFYDMEVALWSHRVKNATPLTQAGSSRFWNPHEWQVE